jgi:hypothetical protein
LLGYLADHNFNEDILAALQGRVPSVDIVRVRELGLTKADDPTILERAAQAGLIVLTHDRKTIPKFAYQRVEAGLVMPGVFEVPQQPRSFDTVLEELHDYTEYSVDGEWEGQVRWIGSLPHHTNE